VRGIHLLNHAVELLANKVHIEERLPRIQRVLLVREDVSEPEDALVQLLDLRADGLLLERRGHERVRCPALVNLPPDRLRDGPREHAHMLGGRLQPCAQMREHDAGSDDSCPS
jgi:hypothetical protein